MCHLGDFLEYASIRREIKEVETLLSRRDHKRVLIIGNEHALKEI